MSAYIANADYDHVVATRDAHRDPVGHFAAEPDFVDTWPAHCVIGTPGVEFHPALDVHRVESVFD
jgi:nicotinamidase/pyrazinamidase